MIIMPRSRRILISSMNARRRGICRRMLDEMALQENGLESKKGERIESV